MDQSLVGLQLLLAEDNLIFQGLLLDFLGDHCGADMVAVTSAEATLQALDHSEPIVLISNVVLPQKDGIWLIRQIRSREAERGGFLPAIAITAGIMQYSCQELLEAGFQECLVKPFDFDYLLAKVIEQVPFYRHSTR